MENFAQLNLNSMRSKKARHAANLRKWGIKILVVIFSVSTFSGAYLIFMYANKLGFALLSLSLLCFMWYSWYKTDLNDIKTDNNSRTIDGALNAKVLAKLKKPITPKSLWRALSGDWQEIFITNKLLLSPDFIEKSLSVEETDTAKIWQTAKMLISDKQNPLIDSGTIVISLLINSSEIIDFLSSKTISKEDVLNVYEWLNRQKQYLETPKPYFGGIGRDWAFGFTPVLEKFSTNISQAVEKGYGINHFMARSDAINAVIHNIDQSGSIALVGSNGIGKTSMIYALAERLIQDKDLPRSIQNQQIVSLNASMILSSAKKDLEKIMLTLFSESIRSGNMIIFLDEAQLFFQDGVGSFDLSQILLPVLQNRRLRIICSFHDTDWQRLKTSNPSLSSMLHPVILSEPNQQDTMKILQDAAVEIEYRTKTIVSYEAIREAYRLSEQYIHELAFPGKAIKLLEQSAGHSVNQTTITVSSVQQAIESTLGVKAGVANAEEADRLLNLEDKIHERMVNQTRAVKVVSNALRRSRAGVSSSKKPIGSFLFLGPTGVGKTELAKSLAAIYFGDEKNMIRLDMSEFQQPDDIGRLLSSGQETDSLLLAIRKQPFSVILLDEIEKAHATILNLLLQLLDEGQLTDVNGLATSFHNSIIIVTSNAGANDILDRINNNQSLDDFERPLIDKLINEGIFRPELINRFDEIVLFRPLDIKELGQVASLMLAQVNKNLSAKNISVQLTPDAMNSLIKQGYDPQFGSRPMRRVIQRTVEDAVAMRILSGKAAPGTKIVLDINDIGDSESYSSIS